MDVLRSKHPGARPTTAIIFEAYGGKPLAFVTVYITDETVEYIARQIADSAGTGGTDLVSLQHWLLRFGVESVGLRHIVREFG